MQRSIDEEAQKKRRKGALESAIVSTLLLGATGMLALGLRSYYEIEGIWRAILLIYGVVELLAIIPIWILYKQRIKEIEGGEEDVATQY